MSYQCPHCGETVREPYCYHERGDCEAQAALESAERSGWVALAWLAWRVLALAGALFFVANALSAPAPGKKAPAPAAPAPGVLTARHLQAVRLLHWGEKVWQIGFQADGTYWCHRLEDGQGVLWSGPWRLVDGEVVIEESDAWVSPDAPPRDPSTPIERRLNLRPGKGGKITGTGWGRELVLE